MTHHSSKISEYQDINFLIKDTIQRQKQMQSSLLPLSPHDSNNEQKCFTDSPEIAKRDIQYYYHKKSNSIRDEKDIIAVINLKTNRILRMNGKIVDQLDDDECVWLVTEKEWDLFNLEILQKSNGQSVQRLRHGKRLIYSHPSALTLPKLKDLVGFFYSNSKNYSYDKSYLYNNSYEKIDHNNDKKDENDENNNTNFSNNDEEINNSNNMEIKSLANEFKEILQKLMKTSKQNSFNENKKKQIKRQEKKILKNRLHNNNNFKIDNNDIINTRNKIFTKASKDINPFLEKLIISSETPIIHNDNENNNENIINDNIEDLFYNISGNNSLDENNAENDNAVPKANDLFSNNNENQMTVEELVISNSVCVDDNNNDINDFGNADNKSEEVVIVDPLSNLIITDSKEEVVVENQEDNNNVENLTVTIVPVVPNISVVSIPSPVSRNSSPIINKNDNSIKNDKSKEVAKVTTVNRGTSPMAKQITKTGSPIVKPKFIDRSISPIYSSSFKKSYSPVVVATATATTTTTPDKDNSPISSPQLSILKTSPNLTVSITKEKFDKSEILNSPIASSPLSTTITNLQLVSPSSIISNENIIRPDGMESPPVSSSPTLSPPTTTTTIDKIQSPNVDSPSRRPPQSPRSTKSQSPHSASIIISPSRLPKISNQRNRSNSSSPSDVRRLSLTDGSILESKIDDESYEQQENHSNSQKKEKKVLKFRLSEDNNDIDSVHSDSSNKVEIIVDLASPSNIERNQTATEDSSINRQTSSDEIFSSTNIPHTVSREDEELRTKLKQQAAELEEVTRARAALEVRLEETRYMLQVFAAGITRNNKMTKSMSIDTDEGSALFQQLSQDSITSERGQGFNTNKSISSNDNRAIDLFLDNLLLESSAVNALSPTAEDSESKLSNKKSISSKRRKKSTTPISMEEIDLLELTLEDASIMSNLKLAPERVFSKEFIDSHYEELFSDKSKFLKNLKKSVKIRSRNIRKSKSSTDSYDNDVRRSRSNDIFDKELQQIKIQNKDSPHEMDVSPLEKEWNCSLLQLSNPLVTESKFFPSESAPDSIINNRESKTDNHYDEKTVPTKATEEISINKKESSVVGYESVGSSTQPSTIRSGRKKNSRRKSYITPVVTLELPDLDEEEEDVQTPVAETAMNFNVVQKYSLDKKAITNTNVSNENKDTADKTSKLPRLPCEESFEYLSKLQHVFKEVDEAILTTPQLSRSPALSISPSPERKKIKSHDSDGENTVISFRSITSKDRIRRRNNSSTHSVSSDQLSLGRTFDGNSLRGSMNYVHPPQPSIKVEYNNNDLYADENMSFVSASSMTIESSHLSELAKKTAASPSESFQFSDSKSYLFQSQNRNNSLYSKQEEKNISVNSHPKDEESDYLSVSISVTESKSIQQEYDDSNYDNHEKNMILFNYFSPFLIASKYNDDNSARPLRGVSARASLISSITSQDTILWAIFQIYGVCDGIVAKNIKTSQISRVLKDADIAVITSSQLDLLLVKVHSKAGNRESNKMVLDTTSSGNIARTSVVYPSLQRRSSLVVQVSSSKGLHESNGHKGDPSALNAASFSAFKELYMKIAEHIISIKSQKAMKLANKKTVPLNNEKLETVPEQLVFMERKLYKLVLRNIQVYDNQLRDSVVNLSGIILRTPYDQFLDSYNKTLTLHYDNASPARQNNTYSYEKSDIEYVRLVWDRNMEQIRQIYTFYASTQEIRRLGSGPAKLLLSFEDCKEMLTDFNILPQLIDSATLTKLFRISKLWEWNIAESTIKMFGISKSHSNEGENNRSSSEDIYDFKASVGNFSLTLYGFIEILSRIACNNKKLGQGAQQSMENLLHLMDLSGGKGKLMNKASRKSVSVRKFVFSSL